mgnify:CR=1 FL=1
MSKLRLTTGFARRISRPRGPAVMAALLALVVAAPASAAERWTDPVLGFSFVPPRGATLTPRPGDDRLVRVEAPGGETIVFSLHRLEQPRPLGEVIEIGRTRVLGRVGNAAEVEHDNPRPMLAGREAGLMYFALDLRDRPDEVFGLALVPMGERTILDVKATGTAKDFDRLRRVFGRVLASLQLSDPADLAAARQAKLRAGHRLVESLDLEAQLARAAGERWFRIVADDGRDVGYLRLSIGRAEQMGLPGVRVRLDETQRSDDQRIDRRDAYFASFDGSTELWSIRTTRRLAGRHARQREAEMRERGVPGGATQSWAETGVRSDVATERGGVINQIEVTRELPTGKVDTRRWPTPGAAYVGLADRWLLRAAFAGRGVETARDDDDDDDGEINCYGYAPDAFDLTLRSLERRSRDDGLIELRVRAAPTEPVETLVYGPDGDLLRWRRGGVTLIATDRRQLQQIWGVRDRFRRP